ncbi:hypothetical protein STENM327S_00523 [Streptomyces tendae]
MVDVDQDGLTVDSSYVLAMDSSLHHEVIAVDSLYGISGSGKYQLNITGRGKVALITSGSPLFLQVTPDKYVNCDADAIVAWSTGRRVQAHGLLHGIALGGTDAGVLAAVRGALGDRLAGDLLGHVPVHRAALVGEHLAQLLERGAQVVGVHGTEHGSERVVRAGAAQASGSGHPETERVGRSLPPAALLVLLLAFVAVVRLLRRKAESEWGVTDGVPRLVRPPVLSGGTAARLHHPA